MTTKTTHTPGLWEAGTRERGRFCIYSPASNGRGICVMSNTQKHDPEHALNLEADANKARIVACVNGCAGVNPEAVKDMLAVCKKMLDARHLICSHFDELRAAIAKAEGRSA